jgi:hypothetical protein
MQIKSQFNTDSWVTTRNHLQRLEFERQLEESRLPLFERIMLMIIAVIMGAGCVYFAYLWETAIHKMFTM